MSKHQKHQKLGTNTSNSSDIYQESRNIAKTKRYGSVALTVARAQCAQRDKRVYIRRVHNIHHVHFLQPTRLRIFVVRTVGDGECARERRARVAMGLNCPIIMDTRPAVRNLASVPLTRVHVAYKPSHCESLNKPLLNPGYKSRAESCVAPCCGSVQVCLNYMLGARPQRSSLLV